MAANPYLSGLNRNNMANNRLYLVDTEENQFIMIAKGWGAGWQLGNVDQLEEFLRTLYQDGDYKPTCLVIGTGNDNDFYDKYLRDAANFNIKAGWEYYKPTDTALIAAAPELLYTCKLLLSYMEECVKINPTDCEYEWNIANSLRTLIAKAEGNVLPQDPTE